uniref:Uncharacterized protein n=1 Tax=Setaria italica TaxID=4555 RepID=K3ZKU1_SETIT
MTGEVVEKSHVCPVSFQHKAGKDDIQFLSVCNPSSALVHFAHRLVDRMNGTSRKEVFFGVSQEQEPVV